MGKTATSRLRAPPTAHFAVARRIALALPGVEEYSCYGTPAFRVRKTLLARLREDGETLVLRADDARREWLMQLDPTVYFTEEHYRGHPYVLLRLPRIDAEALSGVLEYAWAAVAPKRPAPAKGKSRPRA